MFALKKRQKMSGKKFAVIPDSLWDWIPTVSGKQHLSQRVKKSFLCGRGEFFKSKFAPTRQVCAYTTVEPTL
jgi:hypothetical protein